MKKAVPPSYTICSHVKQHTAYRAMSADDKAVDFAELVKGVSLTLGAGLTACCLLLFGQLVYQGVRYKRRGLRERELRSSWKKYICLFLGCLLSIVEQIRVGLNSPSVVQSGHDLANIFLSFPSVILVGCTLFSFSRYLTTVQENKGDDANERLKRKISMASVPLGGWTAYNVFPFCVQLFCGLLEAVFSVSAKEAWCDAGADYNGTKCVVYVCLRVASFTLATMASIYVVYVLVKRRPGLGIALTTVSQVFQLGVFLLVASSSEEEEVGWVWLLSRSGNALNLTLLLVVLIGFNLKYSIFEVAFEASNMEADVFTLQEEADVFTFQEEGLGKPLRDKAFA